MARKKKDTTTNGAEAASTGPGPADAKPGHNAMTPEQRQALMFRAKRRYQDYLGRKKDADANFKNECKLIRADLGNEAIDEIKAMILLETPEGEAKVRAQMELAMRAARYMASPLGSQFEMFPDRQPAEDRAFAEGKRDAMDGKPMKSPYDPAMPQNDAYAEGFSAGTKALAELQRQRDAAIFDSDLAKTEQAIEEKGIAGAAKDILGDAPASFAVVQ